MKIKQCGAAIFLPFFSLAQSTVIAYAKAQGTTQQCESVSEHSGPFYGAYVATTHTYTLRRETALITALSMANLYSVTAPDETPFKGYLTKQ